MNWSVPFKQTLNKIIFDQKYKNFKKENLYGFSDLILGIIRKKNKVFTLYIGNLSYLTREEQLWAIFSPIGDLKRVIMGIHRYNLTPCGFCFIEFYDFSDSHFILTFLSGLKIDGRTLRIDLDQGFKDGRQYGRGKRGGQIEDEIRKGVQKRKYSTNIPFKRL